MKDKRVVFMGTPDFAVPILKLLIEKTNVVLVVSQPDKEVGRKKELKPSPIKNVALENNIPVFQPIKIKKDYETLKNVKPDLIVTCAYGQIVPQEVLDIPSCGCVNVHASLLPKYRGSAPIQWAIMNGDKETGITLMYMDAGMDTGDMIAKVICPILASDNVGTLHDKLSLLGRDLLGQYLQSLFAKTAPREKQDNNLATLAPMIKREDEHLDFNLKGKDIINKIRALNPWPYANTIINNLEVKVIEATFIKEQSKSNGVITVVDKKRLGICCEDGIIYLNKIKPFGKKEMDIKDYLNGINKDELIGKEVK